MVIKWWSINIGFLVIIYYVCVICLVVDEGVIVIVLKFC